MKLCLIASCALLVAFRPIAATAQVDVSDPAAGALQADADDPDAYLTHIIDFLGRRYVTGGELVLEDTAQDVLLDVRPYGQVSLGFISGASEGAMEYEHLRVLTFAQANPWDVGLRWPGKVAVHAGETGLVLLYMRGGRNDGSSARVTFFFERNVNPWNKSLERQRSIGGDWQLYAEAFTFADDLALGQNQFGFHLGHADQWIEMTAPVVLNFGSSYTPDELQERLDSGAAGTTARLLAYPVVGPAPLTVSLDGSRSVASGATSQYQWEFGDGSSATGATAEHTYAEEGSYTVTLRVTDEGGTSSEASRLIVATRMDGSDFQPLAIAVADGVPIIDGALEPVFTGGTIVPIQSVADGDPPDSDADLTAIAYMTWDADRLYVYIDVADDLVFGDSEVPWQDDSVEIYIDGNNDKLPREPDEEHAFDDNDIQLEARFGADAPTGRGHHEGVTMATRVRNGGGGYGIEFGIPWATAGIEPVEGRRFGLELMVNDDDEGGEARQTKLAWFAPSGVDEAYRDPSVWGSAVLGPSSTNTDREEVGRPAAFRLWPNYPNPFNPSTRIRFDVPFRSHVRVTVHDLLGREVARLVDETLEPGAHDVGWDAGALASGAYFCRLSSGAFNAARVMLLSR